MSKRNIEANLRSGYNVSEKDIASSIIFFYSGIFSNFYKSEMIDPNTGMVYFCVEQWMMAQKALLFNDHEIYEKIMLSDKPGTVKMLGRRVSGFVGAIWDEHKYNIVLNGNRLKYSQNEYLKDELLRTHNKVLAEASSTDKIWGIGINIDEAYKGAKWNGENLLGAVLMQVRDELK